MSVPAKHTPGPWTEDALHVEDDGFGEPWINIEAAAALGCIAEAIRAPANARLIAAAPDLLDALRTTARNLSTLNGVRADQGIRGFGDWLAVVEAAIAKAEGR